jgi:hypothetical protein
VGADFLEVPVTGIVQMENDSSAPNGAFAEFFGREWNYAF